MSYIKNIEPEVNLKLADQITGLPGQIASKTLAQDDAVSLTLFAFDQGEEISTHVPEGDAMALVLEGIGRFTIDGRVHFCKAGETIVMPAGKPHAVYAEAKFKMLLTVVFPPVRTVTGC